MLEERFGEVVRATYETAFVPVAEDTGIAPDVHEAVCRALGLEVQAAGSFVCDLRKQNIWPLPEMIANYERIADVLNRSRFYHMLEG